MEARLRVVLRSSPSIRCTRILGCQPATARHGLVKDELSARSRSCLAVKTSVS